MNGIGLYVAEESPNKRSDVAYLPTRGSGIKEHEWCIDWHVAGPIDWLTHGTSCRHGLHLKITQLDKHLFNKRNRFHKIKEKNWA